MAERIALLFPGQGTQKPGMGIPFLDKPEFFIAKDAGEILGIDTTKLLSEDPLTSTHDSQLAILITSLISFEISKKEDLEIVGLAGHSLGQVSALICAGVLDFEEGINFASKRAKATQNCADKYGGAMAALLGADSQSAQLLCDKFEELWIANDNAPGQIVVAGNPESIDKASEIARDYEIKKVVKLPVNGAFHTPYMQDAVEELKKVLSTMKFSQPAFPVCSNDDGRAYHNAEIWQEKLSIHVASPVRWRDCMDAVLLLEPTKCFEVGFGATLAGLAKRCTPDLPVESFYEGVPNG